jgi:hypothetical protein
MKDPEICQDFFFGQPLAEISPNPPLIKGGNVVFGQAQKFASRRIEYTMEMDRIWIGIRQTLSGGHIGPPIQNKRIILSP